jgi:acyl-CoA thioesterase-2
VTDDDADPIGRFLALLDLRPTGEDRYSAITPAEGPPRLFGGQVAAQSLRAATLTVDPGRLPHSLHAYFIRPGRPGVPLELTVERARDGRSFTTRRVSAAQEGEPIFVLDASFHVEEDGEDWQPDDTLDVPGPDEVEAPESPMGRFSTMSPFDIRPAGGSNPKGFPIHPFWVRTKGRLPDDPLLHACAITFISDMGVVGSAPRPGPDRTRGFMGASLDHAVWLHCPARADEWLLFDVHPLRNGGARGLAMGTMRTQAGVVVATIAQEALLRPTMTLTPEFAEAMQRFNDQRGA